MPGVFFFFFGEEREGAILFPLCGSFPSVHLGWKRTKIKRTTGRPNSLTQTHRAGHGVIFSGIHFSVTARGKERRRVRFSWSGFLVAWDVNFVVFSTGGTGE